MNKEKIIQLEAEGKLKKRFVDVHRIKSLIESSRMAAGVVGKLEITKETATTIFREYYESIRQLGDAKWWSLGYEVCGSHEVSMEILIDMKILESRKTQSLDRFRRIRNNANYRGYLVEPEESKEIKEFWLSCGESIIKEIKKSCD